MLIRLADLLSANAEIKTEKYTKNENASLRGAFSECEQVTWRIACDRAFGVRGVVMRFERDGGEIRDIPFDSGCDGTFSLTLDMQYIGTGLYFYSLLFLRGNDTVFSDTDDNVGLRLLPKMGKKFMLTVYDKSFVTPKWMRGGIMYHIFVDRFEKSGRVGKIRDDAVYEDNWNAPVSQYGEHPGAPVKNNLFYGGDLYGVAEKLDYLAGMGFTVIYLSPVFKAYSNHKYDTGDYLSIDEGFGGKKAFDFLIADAKKRGISVILDGVFNHTGDDSLYFNRYGKYKSVGAFGNTQSPYRDWYSFEQDGGYATWWGIEILPKLCHKNDNCRKFFTSEDGVGAKYVREGTGGWRLDVADELPDCFLDELRASVKKADPEAVIIGEVWENAADKTAYGSRRRYLQGKQLDSVMNYPLRSAIINFVKHGDGKALAETLTLLYASYPKCVCDCLMNIIGTHDTDRILTVLGDDAAESLSNKELSTHKMSIEQRLAALQKLKIASFIQYTVYGIPSVFYGDEAGVEGGHDPFCRATFPWGGEDETLQKHYKSLARLRRDPVFAEGRFRVLKAENGFISYERYTRGRRVVIMANVGEKTLSSDITGKNLVTGRRFSGSLAPMSAVSILC